MTGSDGTAACPKARYAFGDFVLDLERGVLFGADGELRLRPKSYAVLAYLVERPGQLISKDELFRAVWGQAIVTEDSITQCLVEIRRVLGEAGHEMIRTVPRRGYLFTAQSLLQPGSEGNRAERARHRVFRSLAAGLLMFGLLALMAWRALNLQAPESAETALFSPEKIAGPSVAVLPFLDMSPGADHAYFGDGMAEEILNLLAEARGMRVIARTSSFALRDAGLDIPTIGRRLGVTHVLEGSVRPAGSRVRVTAQLVDAGNGARLWSQTYDRDLGDVLTVQDDIALNVASLLHASLSGPAANQDSTQRSVAPQAYEHKLRGRHLFARRNEGDVEGALSQFEAAVALEPDYAEAWVGLAGARWVLMHEDGVWEQDEISSHREAALRGVELGPALPEAHLRAMQAHRVAGDVAAFERHFQIARELDPENPLLLGLEAGRAASDGLIEEAIEYLLRAVSSDPLSLTTRHNLAIFLLGAGRFGEARRHVEVIKEIDARHDLGARKLELSLLLREGRYADAWALAEAWEGVNDEEWNARVAMTLHSLGRPADALEVAAALVAADSYEAALGLAEFHAWRGEVDSALEWLEQARSRFVPVKHRPGTPTWLQILALSPFLDPLEGDPRYSEIAGMRL